MILVEVIHVIMEVGVNDIQDISTHASAPLHTRAGTVQTEVGNLMF